MQEIRDGANWQRYLNVLQRMFSQGGAADAGQRKALYNKMAEVLQDLRDREVDGLGPDDYDYNYRLMRATVRAVELDIRAGVDILAPDYAPDALIEIEKRLADVLELRRARLLAKARPTVSGVGAAPQALPTELRGAGRAIVGALVALGAPEKVSPGIRRLRIWRILLRRALLLAGAESRVALLWMVAQPAILIAFIIGLYLLMETNYILNMDVPSFALLGSTSWIMIRQVMLRTVAAMNNDRSALNIPGVRPLDLSLVEAFVYLVIYSIAMVLLLMVGSYFEITSTAADPLGLGLVFCMIWLLTFGLALILGALSSVWSYLPKILPAIQRGMQLFSSIFIVTEQLPEQYKGYILWNPLAHGMQLLRARHFAGYHADDASTLYFGSAVLVVLTTGLAAERLARPRIHPG